MISDPFQDPIEPCSLLPILMRLKPTLPQFLTREHHVRMLALVTEQSHSLPGLGMAFNSLGT